MTEIKDLKNQKGAYKVEQLYLEWILHRIKLDEVLDTKFKKKMLTSETAIEATKLMCREGEKNKIINSELVT